MSNRRIVDSVIRFLTLLTLKNRMTTKLHSFCLCVLMFHSHRNMIYLHLKSVSMLNRNEKDNQGKSKAVTMDGFKPKSQIPQESCQQKVKRAAVCPCSAAETLPGMNGRETKRRIPLRSQRLFLLLRRPPWQRRRITQQTAAASGSRAITNPSPAA